MYATGNPQTKKRLKEMVQSGHNVEVFQPNGDLTGTVAPNNGKVYIEGPHYPQSHKWYAEGTMKNGRLVAIK